MITASVVSLILEMFLTDVTPFFFTYKMNLSSVLAIRELLVFPTAGDEMKALYSEAQNDLLSNSRHLFVLSFSISPSHFSKAKV